MTHEQDKMATPSLAVVPVDPLSVLPVRVNQEGETVTDWGALVKMESSPELVAALIGKELISLNGSEDRVEQQYAERLQNNIGGIINIYDRGLLPRMGDVQELTSLVMERNPRLSDVAKLMVNKSMTVEEVAVMYDVRDTLQLTLEQADGIFRLLGFSYNDEQDIELVDDALQSIQDNRELQFRHTAAEVMKELLENGVTIRDIIDGRVY